MSGSFENEKGLYDLSMKIGELVLFPCCSKVGSGNNHRCRHHQLKDGTGKNVFHLV